jgi:hypothetical protein
MNHEPTVKEVAHMTDQCFCSCGWKSARYFDGAEYAMDEWERHAEQNQSRLSVRTGETRSTRIHTEEQFGGVLPNRGEEE